MTALTIHRVLWATFRVLLLLGCLCVVFINTEMPLLARGVHSMIEEGKRQYDLVKAKTTIPSLGSCWKVAVTRLHHGCKQLDDSTQSDLALEFANCFLEGAGISRHECHSASVKEGCMKTMPDKAFLAYTEFFTHTQSMCFFIMSQVWHEETEKNIDRLSTSAADVAKQLEASEELQMELLSHQQESVTIQQELLDNGRSLGHLLHDSRDSLNVIFSEFRSSTLEQQHLLGMVFQHLSALQSWVVGEVSWLDSIAFYIPTCIVVFFVTSAQRSANARIPSYILLITGSLTERFIANLLLQSDSDHSHLQPIEVVNERLNWWVWLIRRLSIGGITCLLAVVLLRYHDREEVMHQLLQQIQKQNEELLKFIRLQRPQMNSEVLNMDETDSVGYIAVPTTPSYPSAGPSYGVSRSNSSSLSHTSTPNGTRTILREESTPSPVRSVQNEVSASSSQVTEVSARQVSEQDPDRSSSSSVNFSTPRKTTVRKLLYDKSPVSPRYNLRRGRSSTPVL